MIIRMGQGQLKMYQSKAHNYLTLNLMAINGNVCHVCHRLLDLGQIVHNIEVDPLKLTTVKYKLYANRNHNTSYLIALVTLVLCRRL